MNPFQSTDKVSNSSIKYLILPLWLIAIYALGLLIKEASTIFVWILVSFFLLVLLDPVAEFLKKHKWPTAWTAAFLVILTVLITLVFVYVLGYFLSGIVVELHQSKKLFMHSFDSLNNMWNNWSSLIPGFDSAAKSPDVEKVQIMQTSPLGGELGGTLLYGVGSAATVMTFLLLTPILGFFLLAERDALGSILSRAFQDPKVPQQTWKKIVDSTRAFFLGNIVLAVVTYPVFVVLFWAFSVPSVFTIAALAMVLNLIPFAGSLLSGLLPGLALYAQSQQIGLAFGLYACCGIIHFAVADFITPKILGSRLNINATTSTIALVVWGELWGGVGLILAIPLTSLVKIMFEQSDFFWLQWIAGIMSEDADKALKVSFMKKNSD